MIEYQGDEWVTTAQAVEALAETGVVVSQRCIRDWRRLGKLPSVRHGNGRRVYLLEDVWTAERDVRVSGRGRRRVGDSAAS